MRLFAYRQFISINLFIFSIFFTCSACSAESQDLVSGQAKSRFHLAGDAEGGGGENGERREEGEDRGEDVREGVNLSSESSRENFAPRGLRPLISFHPPPP